MTDTLTLNGQVLGQAERATRALLEVLLAETGTPFEQWVTINLVHAEGGSIDEADLVQRLASGLRIDGEAALDVVGALRSPALLQTADDARCVELTAAGAARHDRIRAGIDQITERLYGDVAHDDLVTAGRVLTLVTERAKAELAR